MVDRFLREVKRMRQLRQDINEMTPEEADDDAAEDWVFAARDAQLPPPDLSSPSFKGDAGAKFCKPPTPVGTL